MKTIGSILLTVLFFVSSISSLVTGAHAQVTLLTPSDGATLSPEPTFTWRAGAPYNLYLFISVFYYDLCGTQEYNRIVLPMVRTSLPMPTFWWTKLGRGTPCYWAVLGINTATHVWALSDVFSFTRGADPPGSVPETGIDTCYDWDGYEIVPCPFPDEDYYGQDAQYTTNPMSFTVGPGGLTVSDNVTGLMWQRKDDDTLRRWGDAVSYCDNLNLGGYGDWRLPNEYELQTILDYGEFAPAIDETVFPETDASLIYGYWSSTLKCDNPTWSWAVSTNDGEIDVFSQLDTKYVRCVRGEPRSPSFTVNPDGTVTDHSTGLMWQQFDDGDIKSWPEALSYCEDLCLGGHDDWRMPNVKELRTIVDTSRRNPPFDTTVFPGMHSDYWYWTSTTNLQATHHNYIVDPHLGQTWSRGKGYSYVLCVRGR